MLEKVASSFIATGVISCGLLDLGGRRGYGVTHSSLASVWRDRSAERFCFGRSVSASSGSSYNVVGTEKERIDRAFVDEQHLRISDHRRLPVLQRLVRDVAEIEPSAREFFDADIRTDESADT